VHTLGTFDRAGGSHYDNNLGTKAADEDHCAGQPAGSLENAQTIDSRHFNHQ